MTTVYDTDPNTQTIAAAWASSPLGQPEREVRCGFATTGSTESVTDEPQSAAKRAVLAAALACGITAGAALGVMLFDYTDSTQPTVVLPGSGPSAPQQSVVVAPNTPAPPPNSVVSEPKSAVSTVVPAPQRPADVGTAPVGTEGDTTVIVDIPIPDHLPLPEKPEQDPEDPDPEPPKPEPPVLDDPSFKQPEPPKPEPDPVPPEFLPDLPLAPVPNPDPVIKLPLAPLPELNPQPEPPSLPNFVPPVGFGS